MEGFTKLHAQIITSTVWRAPDHVRLVWITMLALANRHGEVMASIPGLAALANVPLESCDAAIVFLCAPDTYSRTKEHDGRRIEPIDGGWALLNHEKYRQLASREDYLQRDAERKRRARAKRPDDVGRNRTRPKCPPIAEADPDPDPDPDPRGGPTAELAAKSANGSVASGFGPPPVFQIPNADPEPDPDLCSRLAALWQQHTGQKLKAGEFEPLLGVLCDTAERQRIGPGALFVRSAKVFAADCESKSKRPVLRWLIDQFGEWAAPPEHASGEQPKHATMSPLTAEQERDRQAFLRGQ